MDDTRQDETPGERERVFTTTIKVRAEVWRALRALAESHALKNGGRASASAVVSELILRETQARQDATAAHA